VYYEVVKWNECATISLVGTNPVFRKLHEHNIQVKKMKLLGKLTRTEKVSPVFIEAA
jgi:transposase